MAAGKSTVGRLLASRLGWDFVDLDARVLERTGRHPADWIREEGEAAFRDVETAVSAELAGSSGVVLAAGGGWVTRPGNLDALGRGTLRVWLRITAAEALRRAAADPADRPLLAEALADAEPLRAAESLLRHREPLYAEADIAVDVEGKDPAGIVDEIMRRLGIKLGG
jgi:shikimate kinase